MGCGMVNNKSRPFQTDQRDEQPNSSRDGVPQRDRQNSHHLFTQTDKEEQDEQEPGNENGTERVLPRYTEGETDCEGEIEVVSHPRRKGDGIVGKECH